MRRPAPPASIAPTTAVYAARSSGRRDLHLRRALARACGRARAPRRGERVRGGVRDAYRGPRLAHGPRCLRRGHRAHPPRHGRDADLLTHAGGQCQSIATIDEMSGGRAVLGLGVSHKRTVEGWYGQPLEKPVRDMREYVEILRAVLRGEDPPPGERFQTAFHFMAYEPRPDIPIYIGALSPRMLRLAGELGDGVVLWLCNPDYVREVVVPEVTRGRERAGKPLEGFDVVAAVPAAVTDEPEVARARLRSDLIPYFSLPFYRAMLE